MLASLKDPTPISPQIQEASRQIWSDESLPIDIKIGRTFQLYAESRLNDLPLEHQELARRAIANFKKVPSYTSRYKPLTGDIHVSDKYGGDALVEAVLLTHELEHLTQIGIASKMQMANVMMRALLGLRLSVPNSKLSKLQTEFEAMGAQWDVLQLVPEAEREKIVTKLQTLPIDKRAITVISNFISKGSLTREEYIRFLKDKVSYYSHYKMWLLQRLQNVEVLALAIAMIELY